MADDVAMQNFTSNILRGMGTGGSSGASNGSNIGLYKDMDVIQEAPKKFTSPVGAYWADKFFDGMQGFVQGITPHSFLQQIQPPPTPLHMHNKLPNIMGNR